MKPEVIPLSLDHLPAAADLFVQLYHEQHRAVPALPARMENPAVIREMLGSLVERGQMVALLEGDQLTGFLGWHVVEDFRGTGRRGAYCPEYAHAVLPGREASIYSRLYRVAAEGWEQRGCAVHALTLLAYNTAIRQAWYWNGFGLGVVDALRPIQPLGIDPPTGVTVRRAGLEDAALMAVLDAEHWRHYTLPPVSMMVKPAADEIGQREFLARPGCRAWLAFEGDLPLGFLRFEGSSEGAAAIVQADDSVAITGAYLRVAGRGRGIALAVLDAGLREFSGLGYARCTVDFEAFNPEAAAFWMKFFTPVCYSVMRRPETR